MSFKLLAIRPLEGCNSKFLKNLIPNQIYKFYNDYSFLDEKGNEINSVNNYVEVYKIEKKTDRVPVGLYNQDNTKINVSAIVGKNGSGKSALVELMLAAIVRMSLNIDKNFIDPKNLYFHKDEQILQELISNYKSSLKEDLISINIEIYFYHKAPSIYRTSNDIPKIRKLILDVDELFICDFEKEFNSNIKYSLKNNKCVNINEWIQKKDLDNNQVFLSVNELNFFKDFFYTMIINYSHYGYNTLETGEWLKGVFHKNDSYQLPVVINPLREDGNIDINSEKKLASSRFLVNILQEEGLRKISENKTVTQLSIEIDMEKFSDWDEEEKRDKRIVNTDEEKLDILRLLFDIFFADQDKIKIHTNNSTYPYIRDYILLKLYKMTRYKRYEDFRKKYSIILKNDIPSYFTLTGIDNLQKYFQELENDSSHVTDKLRQALFFLRFQYLDENEIFRKNENEKLLHIDNLYNKIENSWELSRIHLPAIMLFGNQKFSVKESLPPIFKTNYFFTDNNLKNNFNNFSSGEKQKIYSINSIIYHIRNLKSISENTSSDNDKTKELIYYKNINIIFDEIELYAHPDYQKKFLNDFLFALNSVYQRFDNLNIIFITHSPFILSDIPKENVLFLVDGKPQDFERMNTFGANITDLLADSFFINDGLMGDFAKKKIQEVIDWLNLESRDLLKKQQYKKIIELIDEPVLKRKLAEMYSNVIDENFELEVIEKEIKLLEERRNKIKKN